MSKVTLNDLKINDLMDLYSDTLASYKDYYLVQEPLKNPKSNKYAFIILDYDNNIIDSWETNEDYSKMTFNQINNSKDHSEFLKRVDKYIEENDLEDYKNDYELLNYQYYDDDDDYFYDWNKGIHYSWKPSYITKEEAFEKYNNSKTLCIHKEDPTTTMLSQIYEGKGWDVINKPSEISSDVLNDLIDSHERIVMLGHGTSFGLIGSVGPEQAPHLKDKKLFALWCNADAYCDKYLSDKKGFFACGNMPSDDNEARAVGFNVSHKYMDDNITYWCKLCADVVEQCLEGNAKAGCKYIRDEYWKAYGNSDNPDEVGITLYNYQRTKTAGEGLINPPKD